MLYPTYLSSFTHLLQADIRPISLLSVLRGNSSRSFFSTKPVIEPPPDKSINATKSIHSPKSINATKSIHSPKSINAAKSVPTQQSATARATAHPATSPISISDQHSRTGTTSVVTER